MQLYAGFMANYGICTLLMYKLWIFPLDWFDLLTFSEIESHSTTTLEDNPVLGSTLSEKRPIWKPSWREWSQWGCCKLHHGAQNSYENMRRKSNCLRVYLEAAAEVRPLSNMTALWECRVDAVTHESTAAGSLVSAAHCPADLQVEERREVPFSQAWSSTNLRQWDEQDIGGQNSFVSCELFSACFKLSSFTGKQSYVLEA